MPSDRPKEGVSDYKQMGMGSANLFVVYPAFGLVFGLPGIVGAAIAFWKSSPGPSNKAKSIALNNAGPLFLAAYFLRQCMTMINANLGTARRKTNVNVPDQHVYKVVDGPAAGSMVLLDDSHSLFGPFNRAQRALQNVNETSALAVTDFFLAGYVFPWSTALCTMAFGLFRLKGAIAYTEERMKRMTGNMAANVFGSSITGMRASLSCL